MLIGATFYVLFEALVLGFYFFHDLLDNFLCFYQLRVVRFLTESEIKFIDISFIIGYCSGHEGQKWTDQGQRVIIFGLPFFIIFVQKVCVIVDRTIPDIVINLPTKSFRSCSLDRRQ